MVLPLPLQPYGVFLVFVVTILSSSCIHNSNAIVILEHSLDGINYHKAATCDLDDSLVRPLPLFKFKLASYIECNILVRPLQKTRLATSTSSSSSSYSTTVPLDGYASSLKNLVRQDNAQDAYYYIRVKSSSEVRGLHQEEQQQQNTPVASIPASCWMNAGSKARIEIHVHNSNVRGLSLSAPCLIETVMASFSPSSSGVPEIDTATLVTPTIATAPPFIPIPKTDGASFQQMNTEHEDEDDGSKQKETRTPPKQKQDDRTWLQKNWMFVAIGFFILANRLGNAAVDQQQPNSHR